MKSNKKLYMFFIHGNKQKLIDEFNISETDIDIIDKYTGYGWSFYGYTTDKKIRKRFVKERNPDLFFERVIENDSTNEDNVDKLYESLLASAEHFLIDEYTLNTKWIDGNKTVIYPVTIVAPMEHVDMIRYDMETVFFNELQDIVYSRDSVLRFNVFNKEINDTLENDYMLDTVLRMIEEPDEVIPDLLYQFDELALYLKVYKNTYRITGGN